MNRRSFMQSILAAGVAPYVVTAAGVLMPVRQISRRPRVRYVIVGINGGELIFGEAGGSGGGGSDGPWPDALLWTPSREVVTVGRAGGSLSFIRPRT